jgi:biopolymer transport protein ExbB
LAFAIERIIYLNLSEIDTKQLLSKVEQALMVDKDMEKAKEICKNTRGPIASIFYQGLLRMDEGVELAEKSIISYGGVQTGLMERNLPWISLFIALSPSLGFLGTVIGMIQAFDKIQQVGDISPTIVAGGMKVALITTVYGLISAMILQVFYNYILSKIDAIVNDMEDSSISLLDMLVKIEVTKTKK